MAQETVLNDCKPSVVHDEVAPAMGKPNTRYVAKAVPGEGWRIWNRRSKRWWGNYFKEYPQALLDELNDQKRPEVLVKLSQTAQAKCKK